MEPIKKSAPVVAPAAKRTIDTTGLIIAMTSGLSDLEFLSLAEFIAGPTEWHEPGPRPCVPLWRSLAAEESGGALNRCAENIIVHHIMDMIKDQHKEAADLIGEIRKYVRPLDNRAYPRPADWQIKTWTDEDGNFRHNVAIVNKRDELAAKIDPIRRRLGFPDTLSFSENEKTREHHNWIMEHMEVMLSILMMDSVGEGPPRAPKEAIPRLSDRRMADLVARELGGR